MSRSAPSPSPPHPVALVVAAIPSPPTAHWESPEQRHSASPHVHPAAPSETTATLETFAPQRSVETVPMRPAFRTGSPFATALTYSLSPPRSAVAPSDQLIPAWYEDVAPVQHLEDCFPPPIATAKTVVPVPPSRSFAKSAPCERLPDTPQDDTVPRSPVPRSPSSSSLRLQGPNPAIAPVSTSPQASTPASGQCASPSRPHPSQNTDRTEPFASTVSAIGLDQFPFARQTLLAA